MILGSDGKRLSKRHGATSVGEYESQGFLPEAMVNFLALLGWSPGDDQEVMRVEELVQRFSMERVLKKGSIFGLKKLDWLSGQHFNASTAEALEPALTEGIEAAGLTTREERREWYLSLIDLLKTRARRIPDLVDLARPFLVEKLEFDPKAVAKHWLKAPAEVLEQLMALRTTLEAATWEPESLEEVIRGYAEEISVGAGKVHSPLEGSGDRARCESGDLRGACFPGKGHRAGSTRRRDRPARKRVSRSQAPTPPAFLDEVDRLALG